VVDDAFDAVLTTPSFVFCSVQICSPAPPVAFRLTAPGIVRETMAPAPKKTALRQGKRMDQPDWGQSQRRRRTLYVSEGEQGHRDPHSNRTWGLPLSIYETSAATTKVVSGAPLDVSSTRVDAIGAIDAPRLSIGNIRE